MLTQEPCRAYSRSQAPPPNAVPGGVPSSSPYRRKVNSPTGIPALSRVSARQTSEAAATGVLDTAPPRRCHQ